MKASRDKFICKNCQMFPRPTSELKRCAACVQLLCQKCCGTKCPLCQHESKDPKISTFTEQPELMDILSGFKTHPCVNFKNGGLEEIPANVVETNVPCANSKAKIPRLQPSLYNLS